MNITQADGIHFIMVLKEKQPSQPGSVVEHRLMNQEVMV